MNNKEIVFNLWYVLNETDFICLLKAKYYVVEGSDEEKLFFLDSRAALDFEVAQNFPIPKGFKVILGDEEFGNIVPKSIIGQEGGEMALFKEVFDELEKNLPKFSTLQIPSNPLMILTPLILIYDKRIIIHPEIEKKNV